MSANMVGKVDIDLLTQVALIGPSDATSWVPMIGDASAFGRDLWVRNWYITEGCWLDDDPDTAARMALEDDVTPERPDDYRFTPLPITVTASEALMACEHYGYQTYSEIDAFPEPGRPVPPFAQTPAGRVYEAMRARLQEWVPDGAQGPWGWTDADLRARADRTEPEFPDGVLPR